MVGCVTSKTQAVEALAVSVLVSIEVGVTLLNMQVLCFDQLFFL